MDFTQTESGVRCTFAGDGGPVTLALSWYGPDILRVQAWPGSTLPPARSLAVVAAARADHDWHISTDGHLLRVTGPALSATIDTRGRVAFFRDGRELLAEQDRSFPANGLPLPEDGRGAGQGFLLRDGDALYGLGQYPDGVMNWRGRCVSLIHGNVTVVVPFLYSTGGWGLLWDNASHTSFQDGRDGMRLDSEVADAVDYYVCTGSGTDGPIAAYRHLTGAAPLMPRAFYGFIQCKERYETAAELVDVVREHRRRGLPLDVIVQDWRYWGPPQRWSGMIHDRESYGDLPGAIAQIHDLHAKVMISIWPAIGPQTPLAAELDAGGHLFPAIHWSGGRIYDAFSPDARAIYWRHARDGLFARGVDAWWMDGTEPEFVDCHDPAIHKASLLAQPDTAAGPWARVLNAFSLVTTQGVYEGQRAATDDRRVFILTRSAFAGQQRYAAATWSGDVSASWEVFARQIPAGLNFCLSGIPYWTTDNGGFFVRGRGGMFPRGVEDPAFREFFLRWFQFSCFCPLMRSHGTQTPREIWQFAAPGETIHDALVDFARLRMRLLPYSYSLAAACWRHGHTQMRALAMDFPDDPQVHDIADQFCYGPGLMACPVTVPMVHPPTERFDVLNAWGHCRVDDANGMRIATFDGLDATEPADDRYTLHDPDYAWTGSNPVGVTSDEYRVELSCDLLASSDRDRTLLVRAAGRVRVELGARRVVDDWQDGPLREHRIPVPATSPARLPLRVIYGHTRGDAVLRLGWEMSLPQPSDAPRPQERDVYLPAGLWHDFWTGEQIPGGQRRTLPAGLDRMPVLVRAGTLLPLGPCKQWHDQTPDEPLEIRIYPGADGRFTLYEDAGDGYACERGECSEIDFTWLDAAGEFTAHARRGSFPGMLERRTLHLVVVRPGHGLGIEPQPQPDRVVSYDGRTVRIRFENE